MPGARRTPIDNPKPQTPAPAAACYRPATGASESS